MEFEDFKVPPMTPTDPAVLLKTMNAVDPISVLGDLGLDQAAAQSVLGGDFSPLEKRFYQPKDVDFMKIMTNYGRKLPIELCLMFFDRASKVLPFTDKEIETYKEVYHKMFDTLFEVCANLIIKYKEDPNATCLYVRVFDTRYSLLRYPKNDGTEALLIIPFLDPPSVNS